MSDSLPTSSSNNSHNTSSTSRSSVPQGNLPDAPPRWQRGCYSKYSVGICRVPDCQYLHDLSPGETHKLLSWKKQEQHLVFTSRSNTNSNTDTNSSKSADRGPEGGGIAELVESAAWIPSMGPQRQQLIRRLKEHFIDVDDEELRKLLPRGDEDGETSIGSLLHESGRCRPCRDLLVGQVCFRGMRCGFCHYPHDPFPASVVDTDIGDRRRSHTRPCKGQQNKYRKHVERVEEQIRADPWSFDPSTVYLPPNIFDGKPQLKSKFMMRMSALIDMAKANAPEPPRRGHASASSSNAAAASQAVRAVSSHEPWPVDQTRRNIVQL